MTAHRSYERFEQGHRLTEDEAQPGGRHGRNAAMVVAVMAALLAVATFLSNEAVKEVITGETHRADASDQLESNRVKIDVAEGSSTMLRVLGAENTNAARAGTAAERREAYVARNLLPADERLRTEIHDHETQVDDANTQHVEFELAEVGLEIGIVLASVSIISGRRWLLRAGAGAAAAGSVLLLIGLLFV